MDVCIGNNPFNMELIFWHIYETYCHETGSKTNQKKCLF